MSELPNLEPQLTPAEPVATGLKPSVAAGLACIFTIVSGIVFLVLEPRNKYVRFWAMQAVLLGLAAFAAAAVFSVGYFVLGYLPFIGGLLKLLLGLVQWAFNLGWFVVYIISIVKAFSNQEWEIPVLGKIARQQLARMDRNNLPTP